MDSNFVAELRKCVDDSEMELSIEETERLAVIHALSKFAKYSDVLDTVHSNSTLPEIESVLVDFIHETQGLYQNQQEEVFRILNLFISQFQE